MVKQKPYHATGAFSLYKAEPSAAPRLQSFLCSEPLVNVKRFNTRPPYVVSCPPKANEEVISGPPRT